MHTKITLLNQNVFLAFSTRKVEMWNRIWFQDIFNSATFT